MAVDTVRAGRGDLVFLVGSREAALALEPSFVPVDAAIVGTRSSRTKLTASTRGTPAAAMRPIRPARTAGARDSDSF